MFRPLLPSSTLKLKFAPSLNGSKQNCRNFQFSSSLVPKENKFFSTFLWNSFKANPSKRFFQTSSPFQYLSTQKYLFVTPTKNSHNLIQTKLNSILSKRLFSEAATPNPVKSIEELEKGGQEEFVPKHKKGRKRLRAADEAWAVIKNIRVSHKKLNYVARTIRGLSYIEAIRQLKFSPKRIGRTVVLRAVESCRYNAENVHRLNPDRCIISEAWVGRHSILKRRRFHARGRMGIMFHRYSSLTVILKEIPYQTGEKKLGKIGRNHPEDYEERLKSSLSSPSS